MQLHTGLNVIFIMAFLYCMRGLLPKIQTTGHPLLLFHTQEKMA